MPTVEKRPSRVRSAENNPHHKLHTVIFWLVMVCLTVQVMEGAFMAPYILVHFGWPELTIKEVCSQMHGAIYDDPDRYCEFPYPMFKYEPEPWNQKNREDRFGHVTPPRPHWKHLEFKGLVKRRDELLALKKAEAHQSRNVGSSSENSNADISNNRTADAQTDATPKTNN